MTRTERILVWSSTAAVSVTGCAYAALDLFARPRDPWAMVNHPLQPLLLKLHILTAPLLVFAVGLITARHILPRVRKGIRARRRSGLAAVAVLPVLVVSGYLLQVFTHDQLLTWLGWLHLGLGIVYSAAAVLHSPAAARATVQVRARTASTLTAG